MKTSTLLVLSVILVLTVSIPWKAQIALANALQVGRDEDPYTWECVGCTKQNQPLQTYIIEQKAKQVKCSLAVYQQYTVLAFRYTNNIKNVGQDLLWAIQAQDQLAPSGCKVQKQMDGMWNSIRDDVTKGLREKNHTKRLIITGISLGGALSVLSYVDIQGTGLFENIEIVTYGAPRVGNKNWAAWFDGITSKNKPLRYFIKGDPIASLPVCLTLLCNYGQTGKPIRCNQDTKICEVGQQEQPQFKNYVSFISKQVNRYVEAHKKGEFKGINSHINGYKYLYDYTEITV